VPKTVPVIAIDGPSASGKGTVAQLVAKELGYHYLDSGALYRIVALAAQQEKIQWHQSTELGQLAKSLHICFKNDAIFLNNHEITDAVRSEEMGIGASEVAVHQPVRQVLFALQQSFRQAPGLVADGRDMASAVFTDATLKIFLTASLETRAQRRYQQYVSKGLSANYTQILTDLQQRDLRDSQRSASPLLQTTDAILLDTTHYSINEAVAFVINAYKNIS
jgi:CMP/dCMP kinase